MSLIQRLPRGLDRAKNYYSNEDAITATKRATYDVQAEIVRLLFDYFQDDYGTPIYERDWEVLIILDACRADLMNEVADDYPFLKKHETYNSIGSNSAEWLKNNFVEEYADEMKKTAMVSGNPHTDVYLDSEEFAILDEVWRYAWEDQDEMFRANYITDRAISVMREHQPERMIVHYMQPHHPFIPYFDGFESELHGKWLNQWRDVRIGLASREEKWRQYRNNLHYVLEYVELLLRSINSDSVVISSDHGEAIGEWGIYGHYDVPLQVLREVPWIETTAEDNGAYTPEFNPTETGTSGAKRDVEGQLEKLGYL